METEGNKSSFFDWIKGIALTFILFALIRQFIFIPIVVDGDSMQPTLHDTDRVFVNKVSRYVSDYGRFDVVVFTIDEVRYVKRIIGLPGDKIQYEDDELYVNGQQVPEPFIQEAKDEMHKYGKVTYDFTLEELLDVQVVPEGHYFVLGDNRLYSLDSRDLRIGFVPEESIEGCVEFVMFPLDRIQWIN